MPVLKVLLITALGFYLALDRVDLLGENARIYMNSMVFFVFNPALVGGSLSRTVTFESFLKLGFMPFNILITFLIGSALGWLLIKLTKPPQHIRGLILGACAAGNMGNLPLIIVPAICKEKASPFGDPVACQSYGLAYASLSMAIGAIYLWSYVYNIVRIYANQDDPKHDTLNTNSELSERLLPSKAFDESKEHIPFFTRIKQDFIAFSEKINLKKLLAPSTTGAIVGFVIGMVPQMRGLLVGNEAPLRVLQDSASLLGDAAIPVTTLILGANLLKGLKGSGIRIPIVGGIIAIRYIVLPIVGVFIVKGAVRAGLVSSDPLYQFVLLLQYAMPPAMNIGTITQLFGAGQNECSVIMLWTYSLASVALTLWSTYFMWVVG